MATFTYTARSRTGEKVQGSVEATDRRAAVASIEKMGRIPISISEAVAAAATGTAVKKPFFSLTTGRAPRMKLHDVLMFSTEMSDLLASGMTLGNGLNLLANRKTGRASDAIIPILRDDILHGSSLSNALTKHPRSFTNMYSSMIRAGEASGALAEVLKRLVDHYERMQEVRDKVITALVYPAIVLVIGVITLLFSLLYVIPKFKSIFEDLGVALPLATQILVNSSKWVAQYGWILVVILALAGVMAGRAVKTERGKLWWHGFLLKIPLIRGVISAAIYANFARTLATLLANGVPVLQALGITEHTVGNAVVANEIRNARDRVTDGTTVSRPLAAGKVFPRMMTDMLAVGEQTGNVVGSLTHVARRYEHQLDRSIKVFTTALEPILIVVMAIIVGFVALSILSAVFNITSGLNTPG